MNYTILANQQGKGGWLSSKMITITKFNLTFTTRFREKYEVKPYITFYKDDDGYLCFVLSNEITDTSYKVTRSKTGGYFVRLPKFLRGEHTQQGRYNLIERDGYFVTDCKLNLEDKK